MMEHLCDGSQLLVLSASHCVLAMMSLTIMSKLISNADTVTSIDTDRQADKLTDTRRHIMFNVKVKKFPVRSY